MTEARKLTKLVIKWLEGNKEFFDVWWGHLDKQSRIKLAAELEETLGNTVAPGPPKP